MSKGSLTRCAGTIDWSLESPRYPPARRGRLGWRSGQLGAGLGAQALEGDQVEQGEDEQDDADHAVGGEEGAVDAGQVDWA